MAPRKEESKQGLIIALVAFVLLTIILGVTTYMGFADQSELKGKADKEVQDRKTKERNRDWNQFQALQYRAYMGHPLSQEDQETLQSLRGQYEAGTLNKDESDPTKKLIGDLTNYLDQLTRYDKDKKQSLASYKLQLDDLTKKLLDKEGVLQKAIDDHKKDREQLVAAVKAAEAGQADLRNELEKAKKEIADAAKKRYDELDTALKKIEDLLDEATKKSAEVNNFKDEQKKIVDKLTKEKKDIQNQKDKLQNQVTPPNVVDYEQPRGKIVSLDRNGNLAYINLGSADNVHPQLTFAVYGVGSSAGGKSKSERKAALEVTNVVSANMSVARVVDVTDPNRDPVIPGDLLFNPAWNSGVRQHVAITGFIDLTGEAHDDLQEFMRNLERQNIVIDAYLDLKKRTIVGAVKQETSYMIVGDEPAFDTSSFLKEAPDERTQRKREIIDQMSKMKGDAAKVGATIIPLRKFLTLIGYRLPRALSKEKGAGYNLLAPTSSGGSKESAEKADKEAPKEKADEDKDKPAKPAPKPKPGKPATKDEDGKDKDKGDKDKDKEDKGEKDKDKGDKDKDSKDKG
jgi:hypothetical protein